MHAYMNFALIFLALVSIINLKNKLMSETEKIIDKDDFTKDAF